MAAQAPTTTVTHRDRRLPLRIALPLALLLAGAGCLSAAQGGSLCLGQCEGASRAGIAQDLEVAAFVLAVAGSVFLQTACRSLRTDRPAPTIVLAFGLLQVGILATAVYLGVYEATLAILFVFAPATLFVLPVTMEARVKAALGLATVMLLVILGGPFVAIVAGLIGAFILFYTSFLADIVE